MAHDWIAILDFGSQYTQLIARRLREQQVYCEILRFDTPAAKIAERSPRGIVLSGGPASVYDAKGPRPDPALFALDLPIFGICYGMQLMAQELGGRVDKGQHREFGYAEIDVVDPQPLFGGLPAKLQVWMSHGDQVGQLPPGFRAVAKTGSCPVAAMADAANRRFGVQFHPEVVHTPQGVHLLRHFLFDVCGCAGDWKMSSFIEESIANIRATVGDGHVLCGLSGGVDSSVVAALLHKAIGPQLHCVFVDNGVCRFGETEQVQQLFGDALGVDLHIAKAGETFLSQLAGVIDPEQKRKIIGKTFIDVFSEQARLLGKDIAFLAQGTLYPDVIESISPIGGPSATIKSHHNVGGLPPDLKFKLIEPLRELFKDEVRALGRELGLPSSLVDRQPFPGPGLAVRILGEVTAERVAILQQADIRVQEEVQKLENYRDIWQSFAVLLPVQSVGVMGDDRTYENVIAVRAVRSLDGMTAEWYRLPYDTLDRISTRIINEVRGVNRVVYDISSKPPATIEWE
ncbi:MAG TPA: glutamine-hydrolyzing GMP synthase [Kiritimatiellia bacterium]|nr:glutamine-hydrolyzing GMP synthase [Kiritimatiellia bacterium]HMO98781.1 glutamine-hydrolyzing GMP synthase [Kiritimatiellia bacterium]HMP97676.1 glutamine-hydrolyzing GMP synthase [Kiritimatiellia bacterium]